MSDPTDSLLEALRAADQSPAGRRPLLQSWAASVATGELSAEVLGDVALRLLETLSEADGSLDMTAASLLIEHGQDRHIEPVQALRPTLRSRVALRDWRLEIDRALSVLRTRRDGGCGCTVDAQHGGSPNGPHYARLSSQDDPSTYTSLTTVRCGRCARQWRIREEHGYHYPIYRWTALASE